MGLGLASLQACRFARSERLRRFGRRLGAWIGAKKDDERAVLRTTSEHGTSGYM